MRLTFKIENAGVVFCEVCALISVIGHATSRKNFYGCDLCLKSKFKKDASLFLIVFEALEENNYDFN